MQFCFLGPSQVLEPRRHACVQELFFGASAEDVLTLLGAPSRVFYKVKCANTSVHPFLLI